MAKILLFETPIESQNRAGSITKEIKDSTFPIGLLYLDAILKNKGYNVKTNDYSFQDEDLFLQNLKIEIRNFNPDIIGISMMTMTRVSTYKAIKVIKEINNNIKVILGGIHATIMYKQLLSNFQVDYICIGEGEDTLPELIESIIENKDKSKIKGIAYKEDETIIVSERRHLRMNLDDLPILSHEVYLHPDIKIAQMISSRGCPNHCSFCCLNNVSRNIWRGRSYKNVVDEVEFILNNFKWVNLIIFSDDNFTFDNKRVINICKEIIKRNIKTGFQCQGRIKPISEEMLYWMERAGFIRIGFGIESGSDKLLKSIHKDITNEDCFNTFNLLKKFPKIKPERYLMVGFPGENESTIQETINFVRKLHKMIKMNGFFVSPLWVYPGTEVYEYGKSIGWIDDDYWLSEDPCPYFTFEHNKEWLVKMANKIAFNSLISQGIFFCIKRVLRNSFKNPRYYLFHRLLNIKT